MALVAVVALIPFFYLATGDTSHSYFGQHLWFGFFAVYGFVMHVTRMPWNNILEDFQCHGNLTYFCVTECFEKLFNVPVTGIWSNFYFVCLGLFLLFEFFLTSSQLDRLATTEQSEEDGGSKVAFQDRSPSAVKSSLKLHEEKTSLLAYLLYLFLVLCAQCLFTYFLFCKHLPLVSRSIIRCSADYCPGPYFCLIKGTVEKQYSVYTLIVLSFITILFCLGFSLHGIYHYISNKI